jgi:protoheme IX farnesyltransferase
MESATNTGNLVSAPAIEGARAEAALPLRDVDLAGAPRRRLVELARDYLALTKPRIISLLLVTTIAAMFVADPSGPALTTIVFTVLGGYLAAGGAGAINHYLERDRDARMDRTCTRPLAAGRIEPLHGLLFGIALGALSILELAVAVNVLAALLALAGLLGYVFVYTMWLKPRTPQNIVIGGAAGAVPPLVGWAAATGGLTVDALYPFAIVFLWTPPHFWALSLLVKDDYGRAGIPMLPVTRGELVTRREILAYAIALVAFTLLPFATGLFGYLYLAVAAALGAGFIGLAVALLVRPSAAAAVRLHVASLAYLALLFGVMAADRLI